MPDSAALALPAPAAAAEPQQQNWQQQQQQQQQLGRYPAQHGGLHQQQQQLSGQVVQQQVGSMYSSTYSSREADAGKPAGAAVSALAAAEAAAAPEAELSLVQRAPAAEYSSSSSTVSEVAAASTAVTDSSEQEPAAGAACASTGDANGNYKQGNTASTVGDEATVGHSDGCQPPSSLPLQAAGKSKLPSARRAEAAGQPQEQPQQQMQQQDEPQQQGQQEPQLQQQHSEPRLPVLACRVMSPKLARHSPFAASTSSSSSDSSSASASGAAADEEASSGSSAGNVAKPQQQMHDAAVDAEAAGVKPSSVQQAPVTTTHAGSNRSSIPMPAHPPQCSPLRAPVAAVSPVRSKQGGNSPYDAYNASPAAAGLKHSGQHAQRSSAGRSSGSSMWGSRQLGQLRSSLDVPPLVEIVRTKYCQASDDSDDSDREFDEKLMAKYGLKQHRL
jgi:hypothetical protein